MEKPTKKPRKKSGSTQAPKNYANELRFYPASRNRDANVAGAWDTSTFAIRVRGEQYVKKLKAFHRDVLDGKAVFAGTFMPREADLTGVIIASEKHLTGDVRKGIKQAQLNFEKALRLKARDDSRELTQEVVKHVGQFVGFIWPMWKDGEEKEVVYGLNPTGSNADYLGPYAKEELLHWAKAGCSYHLKPALRRAA